MKSRPPKNKFKLSIANMGCLTLSLLIGLMIGLHGSSKVLPVWLNWIIAGLFVVLFVVLSFIMTGMGTRREETARQENLLVNSGGLLRSLKTFIISNNPAAHLSITSLSAFDQDMAILDELAAKLESRQELNEQETQTLNTIASHWLTSDQLDQWYRHSRTAKSEN